MLRLSKKVEYALIALMDLARDEGFDPVTTKTLSKQYSIPYDLLSKVLQSLTRKGLLQSVQGVRGGYVLARKAEIITLKEVIEVMEGPIALIPCNHENECGCQQFDGCTIKSPMEIIQMELSKYFQNISVKDLESRYNRAHEKVIQIGEPYAR